MADHTNEETGVNQSASENSRREFLKKAGKFAVYTPPAVLLLMKPGYANICKSYTGRPQRTTFTKVQNNTQKFTRKFTPKSNNRFGFF
jgi:hypothetical protein